MTVAGKSFLQVEDEGIFKIRTHADGPSGKLPLSEEMLRNWPSGDLFGLSQNAGMGWSPKEMLGPQALILNSHGGIRKPDGSPIALGYHTGHWEIGLLAQAAACELKGLGAVPFAAHVSDPCDGRSQGTTAMFDSLAYRNDASLVMRRLVRSLPTARALMGVATCDKSMPAMMMTLASFPELPAILLPGGVTLSAKEGEDAGKAQSLGIRFAHGEVSLEEASKVLCNTCASPGGGCQFLGTAATSQVVGEALGMSLPHSALSPSGEPVWYELGIRSARALEGMRRGKLTTGQILTPSALRNAMIVHAACGGSSNLILHLTAIAYHAGLKRPKVADWDEVNKLVPRLVDVLPNGPLNHTTAQFFLAGGVPELMLKLRDLDLLDLDAMTCTGNALRQNLEDWEHSTRRRRFREILGEQDEVNPDEVIMDLTTARAKKLTSTLCFPQGNLAPEGSVVKSTSIEPSVVDEDGIYRMTGPARVFHSEREAIQALKDVSERSIKPGDVIVLCGRGPLGAGMEEVAQITLALKHLSWGKNVALLTDARFSGVSTGACIGHIGPEALAGGPIGKLTDGDLIKIEINRTTLEGSIDYVGTEENPVTPDDGAELLDSRKSNLAMSPDPRMPDDSRLWAALQNVAGGTWGGCVYEIDEIIRTLEAGRETLAKQP
jgi:putative YjhG/YagF family dehydratase